MSGYANPADYCEWQDASMADGFADGIVVVGNPSGEPVDFDAHDFRELLWLSYKPRPLSDGISSDHDRKCLYNVKFVSPVVLHGDASCLFKHDTGFDSYRFVFDDSLSMLDTSDVTDMRHMFSGGVFPYGCDFSFMNTSKVNDMSYMFYDCEIVEPLDLSFFSTSNVTNMRSMFAGCRWITSLDVSSFDTSKVTDMSDMFNSCQSLESLDISGFDTSNVRDMGRMFRGCASLTSLDVSGFDTSNVDSMSDMFNDCKSLKSLDVKSFVAPRDIRRFNFDGCDSLSRLDNVFMEAKDGSVIPVTVEGRSDALARVLSGVKSKTLNGQTVSVSWKDTKQYAGGVASIAANKAIALRRLEPVDNTNEDAMCDILFVNTRVSNAKASKQATHGDGDFGG